MSALETMNLETRWRYYCATVPHATFADHGLLEQKSSFRTDQLVALESVLFLLIGVVVACHLVKDVFRQFF